MNDTLLSALRLIPLSEFLIGAPAPPAFEAAVREARRPSEVLSAMAFLCASLVAAHPAIRDRQLKHRFHESPPEQPQHWSDWQRVADLFLWLSEPPAAVRDAIAAESALPLAGRRAAEQADAGALASLLDLVHDVWEHLLHPYTPLFDAIIKTMLLRHPPRRVVDYGAGAGYFTFYLASLGCHVHAVELNPVKQEFLRFSRGRRGMEDRIALSPPEAPCDCALAINLFDHMADASQILPDVAAALAPGGLLFYQAAFPADGYHTSDKEVIDRVFTGLHTLFESIYASPVQHFGFEVMRRRDTPAALPEGPSGVALVPAPELLAGDRSALRPRLHETVTVEPMEDGEDCVLLHSPMFYLRTFVAPSALLDLVRLCDGEHTVAEITAHMEELGADAESVWKSLLRLWQRRFLGMKR
ncbi:class I SAM-dependent methyltransferase [Sorangium sp. So ce887]|uniref:class I SAM-dependent methyltransferase n=1 Tax=Sorangium sp. So ce887 TaxID=3133324 RepID=UPI003F5DCFA3